MPPPPADNNLPKFIIGNSSRATTILGGSATPALSLDELVSLSTDQATTSQRFKTLFTTQKLPFGSEDGEEELRINISKTYNPSSKLTPGNVIATNGTTGANHIICRSLLEAGDHVLVQYPVYGPLVEEPRNIGCEISYFRLDPFKEWALDPESLGGLIKPGKTKMIILNNPANPTGTYLATEAQRSIIRIAKEHDIVVFCDEIFRPLFHDVVGDEMPTSLNDHADLAYDNVATSCSMSKCYGLSGVRVGWITTRSSTLYDKFMNYRKYSILALSQLDETVAAEALSPRCRPGIMAKHLAIAKRNLNLIEAFITDHSSQCEWVRPTAGGAAFVKFKDHRTGEPVDDVDFCLRLIESKKILLSPATFCFVITEDGKVGKGADEFKGRVRFHFTTTTDVVERGLKGLGEFLEEEKKRSVTANGTNGVGH